MSRLLDSILSGFGRHIGWKLGGLVLLGILSLFATSDAHAACNASKQCDTKPEAYQTAYNETEAWRVANGYNETCFIGESVHNESWMAVSYGARYTNSTCNLVRTFYYPTGWQCPDGKEFVLELRDCAERCTDRNAGLASGNIYGKWTMENAGASQCIAGCTFVRGDVLEQRSITMTATGQQAANVGTLVRAIWEYSGDRCDLPEQKPREEEKPQTECVIGGSYAYCARPDGGTCHTATTGRTICWAPGETGQKTDGSITQANTPGTTTPNPPDGSTTTNVTNVSNTTNNTSSSTTIINYATTSGGPAGSGNQGQDQGSDGKPTGNVPSGGSSTCGGPGQPACNSSNGGGDCSAPPTSAGDPLLVQIAHQGWRAACSAEVLDGKLRDDAGTLAGATPGLGEGESIFADGAGNEASINTTLLGGGGSCPVTGSYEITDGVSFTVPSQFCDTIAALRWLFLTIAYAWALRILV